MGAGRWPGERRGWGARAGSASPPPRRTGLEGGPRGKFPSEGVALRGSRLCSGPSVRGARRSWRSPRALVGRAFSGELVAGPRRGLVFICPRPSRAPAGPAPPHPDRRARGPSLPGPSSAGGLSRTGLWRAALPRPRPRPPPSRPDELGAFQIAPLPLGGRGAGGPLRGAAGLLPCWVPGPARSAEPNLAHLNNV